MLSTDHHYNSSSSAPQRPKTAVCNSSPRVPVSKTAAYSWLQVQKIMESSGQQPKSETSENEPAASDKEQPSKMAALPRTRNNNLSTSSSSSSLNSSVSSDSFSADVKANDNNENESESDKRVCVSDGPSSLSANTAVQGKNSHNRIWDPET